MAFDRTSQQDLDWLHTEVLTDPISMGYVPGSTQSGVISPLNDGDANVGGQTTGPNLTPQLLLDAFATAPDDLTPGPQFTQGELEFIKFVVEATSFLEEDIERYRAAITNSFQANATVRQTLEAQSRRASRAEVMFGTGTTINNQDWFAARDTGNIVPVVW